MKTTSTFGRVAFKEDRERAEFTQLELAVEIGVTPRTISNWENGHGGTPSKRSVRKALNAMNARFRKRRERVAHISKWWPK